MGHFFFHLHECGTILEDPEGQDCGSIDEAVKVATANARDMMIGDLWEGQLNLTPYIVIMDDGGKEVQRVRFIDAVSITGPEDGLFRL